MSPTSYSDTSTAGSSATDRDYPRDKLVHELFDEQATIAPDAIAVTFPSIATGRLQAGDCTWSYAKLNDRADSLAEELKTAGVGGGDRVGIFFERSANMVAAILAVLKAGAAYVPIDSSYPKARIHLMIETAKLRLLITDENSFKLAQYFGLARLYNVS